MTPDPADPTEQLLDGLIDLLTALEELDTAKDNLARACAMLHHRWTAGRNR